MPAATCSTVSLPVLADELVELADELVVALLFDALVVVLAEALLALPDELLPPLARAPAKNCRPVLSADRPRNIW